MLFDIYRVFFYKGVESQLFMTIDGTIVPDAKSRTFIMVSIVRIVEDINPFVPEKNKLNNYRINLLKQIMVHFVSHLT